MKHKNISVPCGKLFKSALVALLMSISFTSWSQIITTFAGNGYGADAFSGGYSGDGGPATTAELYSPEDIGVDASGNVYIADAINNLIRIVNTSGTINTFAGNGYGAGVFSGGYSGDGGPATAAELYSPQDIALDASGNIYIADAGNNLIRMVNTSGIISTFAGNYNESGGYSGDGGPATAAQISSPYGIAADASGNIYIADTYNSLVRIVNTSGIISTFAGIASGAEDETNAGYSGDGGPATAAELNYPWGVTVDASGNVYIADEQNNLIRIVNTSGIINTFAGNYDEGAGYSGDGGPATAAKFSYPTGVAVDASGNVYIADAGNNLIRGVNTSGIINTLAGIASGAEDETNAGYSGDGGAATAAELNYSTGIAVDASGSFYIADNGNDVIRKVGLPPLSVSGTVTANVTCNGGSSGSALVNTSGGISPYTYSWVPSGGINSTASGLNAGTYTISVTDNASQTASAYVTITQPNALRDSIVTAATVKSGCGNGSATVGVKYGTPPYTYSWSRGGGNNATATGLSTGTYTVTVYDAGSCSTMATVNIERAIPLSSATALAGANVSCYGGSNGQAKVSVNGGAAPLVYSWSPVGGSTYIANGLSAGTYSVTIMDNCGTSASSSIIITQPAMLRDSAIISYPACAGTTGSATIGVKGGTSPYNYTWSPNVSTTASATGLTIRGYAVTVKDAKGCINPVDFSISQPPVLRDSIVKSATVNLSCNGSNTGSATVGVKYGSTPYTYIWSPAGGNNVTATGLSAGTYTVTVSGGSCSVTASVVISQPGALLSTASVSTAITCYGSSTGKAKATVSGGSSPYTYSWSPVSSAASTATALSAGTYTVTVSDKCDNSTTSSVTLTQPVVLFDSVASLSRPACGTATGSASIGVTGGTSPYRYTWTPNVSTTATATGLTARSYVVQVKDVNGCYNNLSVAITCSQPVTATYKEEASTPAVENINLYPNPNTGQFTISGLQQGMILEMYDYTGKKISTTTVINETMQLNIKQANGVYLIRILDKDGNLVDEKKAVKTQ